jgi:hypothetical protein
MPFETLRQERAFAAAAASETSARALPGKGTKKSSGHSLMRRKGQ